VSRRRTLGVAAAVVAALALAALPAGASAHAVLEESTPARGETLQRQPESVVFRFNEPVEASFGAVRVYAADGERVDEGDLTRPDGSQTIGIRLRPDLPDGSYAATFRVISADSHPVSGGFVFSLGRGGAAADVGALIEGGEAGPVTDVALGAAKALTYAATALLAGGVLFLLVAWRPGLASVTGAGPAWMRASEAFARRVRTLGQAAAAAGVAAGALGIVAQGAVAGGTTVWSAIDPGVIEDVLSTRFGTVWGLRIVAFAGLLGLLALPVGRRGLQVLRPASLGATGAAVAGGGAVGAGAIALAGALVVFPALAGHASTQDPELLLVPLDIAHVAAMSAWLGGLVLLAAALPAATRMLEPPDRTRLLAATVPRFSAIALVSVAVLLATGIVQSILHLSALSDLVDTGFGRAILVKAALLGALVGLGVVNRQRVLPRLRRLGVEGQPTGAPGRLLRTTLRVEIGLLVVVLGVTGALTAYAPPSTAGQGPFAASTELGEAKLDVTVDPAEVGRNEIHLYLFDSRTGAQYGVRELGVTLSLPEREIGPLEPRVEKAGPGHYIVPRADLLPEGDWELHVASRVSEFEQHRTTIEVPVE
jgi:copper transport protein